jgi:hypothetical protein
MATRISSTVFSVFALAVSMTFVGSAVGRESYWEGDTSTDWNNANNWCTISSGSCVAFVPQASGGFNTRAVIGTDSPLGALNSNNAPFGSPVISAALLPAAKATIGGLYLGTRERDFTLAGAPFVNLPAPAAGALVGALTINAGTLNNITTTDSGFGADGRIYVGQDGRGYLTMNGGTLTGTALIVAGENVTTGNGTSLVDLRGNSTLTVNGSSTFSRRLRVEGSGVNFSSSTQMTLDSTNTYTAAITNATAHSPLKVTTFGERAVVGGALNVEFSGAAAARDPITSLGTKWSLVQVNSLAEDAIDGSFSNVGADGSIAVSGLDAAHSAPLGAMYAVRKRASGSNTLLELSYEQVLILTVDRDSGVMSIRNPYSGQIAIDSYSIASARGSMKTTFAGLGTTTPGAGDWAKGGGNNANVIAEVKVPDQTPPITNEDAYNLFSVPSVSIGNGFDKFAVASDVANFGFSGEDLIFSYGGPETGDVPRVGHIEYIGTKFYNNLVLRVNPNTGVARLKNDSHETLVFDGFEITSTAAAVNNTGFTAITGGTGTWQTDAEGTTGLSQVNFTGARTLAPGEEAAIGDISSLVSPFASADAQNGLSMRFILAEGLESTSATGDYNADGIVDAADYVVWRKTDGSAQGYTDWQTSFGNSGSAVPELEFRPGSVFFDTSLGSGSGGMAVPEPGTALPLVAGLGSLLFTRRRKLHRSEPNINDANQSFQETGHVGVSTMSRRVLYLASIAIGIVTALIAARPAPAATGGLPITNFDMELPGPSGTKVIAFDATGAPTGVIPGWTFTGPGTTLWGDSVPGDSGTEGGGSPGNALLLNTHDGKVYQTVPGHTINNPMANQQYRVSFDAWEIFSTYSDPNTALANGFRLTSRLYYGAYPGTTLMTQQVLGGTGATNYEFLIPQNSPLLTPAVLGQSLGIEFDTTSVEYSINEDPMNTVRDIAESWAHVDDVVFEIVGIVPGDLNGDGLVNVADGTNLRNNLQRYTPFEAEGELTGDNVVNLNDFRVLKNLIAAPGSGSGGLAGGGNVPEPSSILLLTMVGLSIAAFKRRRSAWCRPQLVVVAIATLGSALIGTSESKATLLAYDPFLIGGNPAAGQYIETTFTGEPPVAVNPLAGQNPTISPLPSFFAGPWTLGSAGQVVQAAGLSYLGTPSQGGSVNGFGRTDRFFATQWDNTTVGTFYIGVQANFGSTPDGNMGYRAIEFYPPNVTPAENRVGDIGYNQFFSSLGEAQQNAATAKMQVNWNFPGASHQIIQKAPQTYNADGLTHLLVLKFELSATAASDSISLYFDPKTPIQPSAPTNLVSGIDVQIGGFGPASFGNGLGPTTVLDEIRVGTTFADVLPPNLPIPGDVNDDDMVDILDYNIIIANMNLPGGLTLAQGDVDGDGKVTIGDYRFWKERRTLAHAGGGGLAGSPFGIPEPSTLALTFSAALLGMGRAGRRRSRC